MGQKSSRQFCSVSRIIKNTAYVFIATALVGCVGSPPNDDYVLTKSALEAAKESDAARYAPSLWYSAEEAFRGAVDAYKDRSYSKAKALFVESRYMAERAENAARLAKQKSGDVSQ